jgi:hypothetical protein
MSHCCATTKHKPLVHIACIGGKLPGQAACTCSTCIKFAQHRANEAARLADSACLGVSVTGCYEAVLGSIADENTRENMKDLCMSASNMAEQCVPPPPDTKVCCSYVIRLKPEDGYSAGDMERKQESGAKFRYVVENPSAVCRALNTMPGEVTFMPTELRLDPPSLITLQQCAHVHVSCIGDDGNIQPFTNQVVIGDAQDPMGPMIQPGRMTSPVYIYEINDVAFHQDALHTMRYCSSECKEDIKELQSVQTTVRAATGDETIFKPSVCGKLVGGARSTEIWIPLDWNAYNEVFPNAPLRHNTTAYILMRNLACVIYSVNNIQFNDAGMATPRDKRPGPHCLLRYVSAWQTTTATGESKTLFFVRLSSAQILSFINKFLSEHQPTAMCVDRLWLDIVPVGGDGKQPFHMSASEPLFLGVKGISIPSRKEQDTSPT